jgi:hypothetical protein
MEALAQPVRDADEGAADFESDDANGDPRGDVVWGHRLILRSHVMTVVRHENLPARVRVIRLLLR